MPVTKRLLALATTGAAALTGLVIIHALQPDHERLRELTSARPKWDTIATLWTNQHCPDLASSEFGSPLDDTGQSAWCTADEIAWGSWALGPEIASEDDLRKAYNYTSSGTLECQISSDPALKFDHKDTAYAHRDELDARHFRLARPVLVPTRKGCRIFDFDRRKVIVRLLRSRAGLCLAGDSLSRDHFFILTSLMWDGEDNLVLRPNMATLYLNPKHPDAPAILHEAGVTFKRADQPLASFYVTGFVLSVPELYQQFTHAPSRFSPIHPETLHEWYSLYVSERLSHPVEFTRTDVLEEPSVLLLNAGAHWSVNELSTSMTLTADDIWMGYRKVLDEFERKIMDEQYPISLFLRTTAPGHMQCEDEQDFDNEKVLLSAKNDPARRQHNHHYFYWMNDMVRSNHSTARSPSAFDHMSTPAARSGRNPPWRVMDVWPMSVKRPDGHLAPPVDCLHWCRPGVEDWWHVLFWQQMMLEARNRDYYEGM